jgi:hypothetical protein
VLVNVLIVVVAVETDLVCWDLFFFAIKLILNIG